MRRSTWPLLIAVALMMAVAVSARAADSGTVSGAVFDRNKEAVADATVKISGDRLSVGRTVQTDSNGVYRFEYVLPGEYAVEIDRAGVGGARRSVIVEVGRDTQADVIVGLTADNWMSDVSYTWSRFEGNFDLDYSLVSVYNTASFIQDGPGANVEDPNRFGPLFEDRPHVFKVFASYASTSRVTLSGYLRVQSGTPWAARGRDWPGAVLNYLEPAGSHRNPAWTNLDVMAAYRLPLSGRTSVSFEARLLNVFDNQSRLSTDAQKFLDVRMEPTPPYLAPYLQPNPFFSTGSSFAPPRRLYVAAVANF